MGEEEAWETGAAEWVERIRGGMGSRVHAHDASVLELLPAPAGPTLDVGCGEGRWTRDLAARGYDVMGVDGSETLVALAREVDPNGRYEVARVDALPVEASYVQLLLCVNVLPHVEDMTAAAREFARVTAPGGAVLVGTIHPVAQAGTYDEETDELRLHGYFVHEAHAVPLGDHEVFHQHRTIEDYVTTFLDAGFSVAALREVPGPSGSVPLYLDLLFTRG